MAQISRKKSIIKGRQTTFHARPKEPTKREKILAAVAKPAAFIHKQATSETGKKVISGVGSFLRNWAEASRAAQKRQYGHTPQRRTGKKHKASKRRR